MKKANKKERKLNIDRRFLTSVPALAWWLVDKLEERHSKKRAIASAKVKWN